jgi:cytochrome c oxidase subunit 4
MAEQAQHAPSHDDHGDEHADDGAVHVHVHSVQFYAGILGALMLLTIITVATSYLDIDGFIQPGTPHGAGGFNLALAMIIATMKASLVVTFFMHLREDARFNALVFIGSVLFAGVFLAYTMNDTAHRGEADPFDGVHVLPTTGERAPGGVGCRFIGEDPEAAIDEDRVCVLHNGDLIGCVVGPDELACVNRTGTELTLPLSELPAHGAHHEGEHEGEAGHGGGAGHDGSADHEAPPTE